MFYISFTSPDRYLDNTGLLLGEIEINDELEIFAADLTVWTKRNYINHWNSSLKRATVDGCFSILCCSRGELSSNVWAFVPIKGLIKVYNSIMLNSEVNFTQNNVDPANHEQFFQDIKSGKSSEWQFNRP